MKKKDSKIQAYRLKNSDISRVEDLYKKVSTHINETRQFVRRTIDNEMVKAHWLIGRDIIEEEQHGKVRAEYGSYLIKELSERLNKQFGKGFGISTLKDARQFYLIYADYFPIGHAVRGQSSLELSSDLGWIHSNSSFSNDAILPA